jgi:hypothetical protein
VLHAFSNICKGVDENKKALFESGIIPLLLSLVNSSDRDVWQQTVILLSNIYSTKSTEIKNSIINCGIFDVYHKKLLEV